MVRWQPKRCDLSVKALIFGASGQDGFYLRQILELRGVEVTGVSRSSNEYPTDVRQLKQVNGLIRSLGPDLIFHLAANSTTRHSALFENHETISTGALNVLESAWEHARSAKIFITGSGVQFLNRGEAISEADEFEARSPYAVARIQSTFAARYYRQLGLKTYVGFLFHHESPLRKPSHVSKMVAQAVRRIKSGQKQILSIGNLAVEKEWTFAGDVAEGILQLLSQDSVFEAAIGSGETHSIEEWVERCFALAGLRWNDYVQPVEGFIPEYMRLQSNPTTIKNLGWQPKVGFDELAQMMVSVSN